MTFAFFFVVVCNFVVFVPYMFWWCMIWNSANLIALVNKNFKSLDQHFDGLNQVTNQLNNQTSNQPNKQPTKQATNQTSNQPTNQTTSSYCTNFQSPKFLQPVLKRLALCFLQPSRYLGISCMEHPERCVDPCCTAKRRKRMQFSCKVSWYAYLLERWTSGNVGGLGYR